MGFSITDAAGEWIGSKEVVTKDVYLVYQGALVDIILISLLVVLICVVVDCSPCLPGGRVALVDSNGIWGIPFGDP